MTHRSPARYLAPLALVAFVVALVLVVGGSTDGAEQTAAPTPTPTSTAQSAEQRERRERRRQQEKERQETYTVQPGDTPLGIAEETGVPLETLEELNPDLDPQALSVGDEIRIR